MYTGYGICMSCPWSTDKVAVTPKTKGCLELTKSFVDLIIWIFSQVMWQPKRVWTACNETQFQIITNFSEEWQDKIKICNDLLYNCICVTQYVCSTCQHSMKILRRLYRGITQYFHSRGPGRPSFSWLGQGGLSGEYGS